jgi:predicted DCC family thiol-disulfide oxidoreductase YuxK
MTHKIPDKPVVFFDGVCNLCNTFVDFIVRHDPKCQFLFAPLQGPTAEAMLDKQTVASMSSVVLAVGSRRWARFRAVRQILWRLRQPWPLVAGFLWIVPPAVGDLAYGLVAKRRYRLFGRRQTCRVPTAEERQRFLD